MARFSNTVTSEADVDASPSAVWKVLTDPKALVRLTPLLCSIDDHGETWVWHMQGIHALGVGIEPVFTEKMTFEELSLISYSHQPPKGSKERIGAEGRYELSESAKGSHLKISLRVDADLPLPKAAAAAVQRVMKQTMDMMGDRFSRNLLRELGAKQLA